MGELVIGERPGTAGRQIEILAVGLLADSQHPGLAKTRDSDKRRDRPA